MDDSNKYINTYIENAIGMVHEYVNMIVQLKTQLKIVNDLIKEKDEVILSLQEQNETNKHSSEEIDKANANAKSWEEQFNSMKGKVSIIDALTNQFNDAKKLVLEKNQEIQKLISEIDNIRPQLDDKNKQVDKLSQEVSKLSKEIIKLSPKPTEKKETVTVPKKVINTKNTIVNKPVVIEPDKNDDF